MSIALIGVIVLGVIVVVAVMYAAYMYTKVQRNKVIRVKEDILVKVMEDRANSIAKDYVVDIVEVQDDAKRRADKAIEVLNKAGWGDMSDMFNVRKLRNKHKGSTD